MNDVELLNRIKELHKESARDKALIAKLEAEIKALKKQISAIYGAQNG